MKNIIFFNQALYSYDLVIIINLKVFIILFFYNTKYYALLQVWFGYMQLLTYVKYYEYNI